MTTRRPRNPIAPYIREALEQAGLMDAFERRPDYQRNDYVGWITQAVRVETRQHRLQQMLDELRLGNVYMRMPWRQGRRAGPKAVSTPAPTVDAYLEGIQDEPRRQTLAALRRRILELVPQATETISYGMPTFKLNGRPFIGFTANKRDCSLHTMSQDVKAVFGPELDGYATTKEAVHFHPDNPLPPPLLERIVISRAAAADIR